MSHSTANGDRPPGQVAVVVAAAGRGERLGGALPKALAKVAERALLDYTLEIIATVPEVDMVVVAGPPGYESEIQQICDRWPAKPTTIVTGGLTRKASVTKALKELPAVVEVVLIHDAARAFAPRELFSEVIAAVHSGSDAVVPGLPVADTIKRVDAGESVLETVDRSSLRGVQTPQGFDRGALYDAHRKTVEGTDHTDDAGIVASYGFPVLVVPGKPEAFKVTTPFDIAVARAVLADKSRR